MGEDPKKAGDGVTREPDPEMPALAEPDAMAPGEEAEESWGCDYCVFFDPTGHNSQKTAIGPCRRFPGDKPTVSADEWCGEFRLTKQL